LIKLLIVALLFLPVLNQAYAQVSTADSPYERKFGDVKFLDAYFGTSSQKMEVEPGDQNVPFTAVFANIGSFDITGIRGQLSVPFGFSAADGPGSLILADHDANAVAGEVFYLTFYVNIENGVKVGQYSGSVKVDYTRLRESGTRDAFFDFKFKVTGDSVVNMRALDPILTSIQNNHVVIEISNDGTAPVSGVDVVLANTQTVISSTSQSVTNVENVVIKDNNWDLGTIPGGTKKYFETDIYVPESLKGKTLRTPMDITYFNAHGDRETISRIVDFYVKGFIDVTVYDVRVIELSGKPTIIGEIINEGNEDALFGFVTVEPLGNSNIKKTTQFIDEIETDSPVPFNVPVEFDGEARYGEHDVRITVRYKDDLREESVLTHDVTIFIEDPSKNKPVEIDYTQFLVIPVAVGIGLFAFSRIRKRKQVTAENK
jgi:hypothetical protein